MNNQASCLCGSVSWEISAEPFNAFNCHCKMCRKAHGAAFATYWFVEPEQVSWVGGTDSIVHYRSSPLLTRSFCATCGSVVPYPSEQGSHWVVPGGCHDDGKPSDCHIFAAHHAPWFEITGDLPRHDDYPEHTGMLRVEEEPGEAVGEDGLQGSCLCDRIAYRITGPFKLAQHCHCHRCRRARAAAHATNGFVALDDIEFLRGEDELDYYKVPDAGYFMQVFCRTCGSKMPRLDPGRGIAVVPFGSLDEDPGIRASRHIYVDDMAHWYRITDDLPQYGTEPRV
ncbi:MAG: GFA family protein [Gammaproteobacteria bacterium]|nr:GFA family protein [Gammaproteobacteria bacterium]